MTKRTTTSGALALSDDGFPSARRVKNPLEKAGPMRQGNRLDVTMPPGSGDPNNRGGFVKRYYAEHPDAIWQSEKFAREPLGKIVEQYLRHLKGRAQATSPHTIKAYRQALEGFLACLAAEGVEPVLASLTPANGDRWVASQRERKLSEEAIAIRQYALKAFAKGFVFEELELTHWSPLQHWKRMRPDTKKKPRLTEEEIDAVLDCFNRFSYHGIRDRALVYVFLTTGLRFAEVVTAMTVEGLDLVTGEFTVPAKGRKEHTVRMTPNALKAVRAWLRVRQAGADHDALWTTEAGAPLGYWAGQRVFYRMKRKAGMPHLHAHLFRHTFAQVALEKGAPIPLVQDMMGHANDATTRRYSAQVREKMAARQMPQYAAR